MIVRQFLLWTRDASAGRRAEAAAALARAYLHGTLGAETAAETKTALLTLLDDPSALVRRALAEAVATSPRAPRPLIVALASDEPEIACLVLGRSPVLMDADLVDCAALGCDRARIAIAGRAGLSKPVAAALAEVAGPAALVALARNRHAQIGLAACLRMLERHGAVGALREALQLRDDIAVEVRQALAARNGIMLLSHYQHLERHEGMTFGRELVLRGAEERLVPILMTAACASLALVPLIVAGNAPGHEIEHPMAIVILGGLISSTALNLLLLPALYARHGEERVVPPAAASKEALT